MKFFILLMFVFVVLTKQDICAVDLRTSKGIVEAFNLGKADGATHMLLIWNCEDVENSFLFTAYSYPGAHIDDLINFYDVPGVTWVSAVFSVHLDIDRQLNGTRWYLQ